MAEIDKIIAKQPAVAPQGSVARAAASAPAQRAASESAPVVRSGPTVLWTWVSVLLGVAVAAAVTVGWPYAHACGLSLYGYMAAAAGVLLVGLWGTVMSWKRRIAAAHVIAVLVTLTGGLILGKTILDRSSYPSKPSTWSCGAP